MRLKQFKCERCKGTHSFLYEHKGNNLCYLCYYDVLENKGVVDNDKSIKK